MSVERRIPVVGTLWVVLPRSAAVFDCASSPAVPVGWSGWDMRAQKHPDHKQDAPIVPRHPLVCPSRAFLVLAAGCDCCAQGADDGWDLRVQDLDIQTLHSLGIALQRSDALLSQTPLHEKC